MALCGQAVRVSGQGSLSYGSDLSFWRGEGYHGWSRADFTVGRCDDQAAWQQLALPCVGESRACIVKTQLYVASNAGKLAERLLR